MLQVPKCCGPGNCPFHLLKMDLHLINFTEELVLDSSTDASSRCVVRWWLKKFVELLEPFSASLKEKSYSQLSDEEWVLDLSYRDNSQLSKQAKYSTETVSRYFSCFPYFKNRVIAAPETKIKDDKVEKYRSKLQRLFDYFLIKFEDLRVEMLLTFLINMINDY